MRPAHELVQVVSLYKASFIEKHHPFKEHIAVLHAIEQCRTAAMGGHVDECNTCGHLSISYNSCRNRHCPKCQSTNRERWIAAWQSRLHETTCFHVVFTLPQQLNSYCLHHPKAMYDLLFRCSEQTIECFARDPRHLGAQPGITSILHTWGQNLSLHPHIHMIVPGGGFTDTGVWKHTKSKGKYLFPVKAMSTVFKHKYMEGLLLFLKNNQLTMDKAMRKALYNKDWVVYAKQSFAGSKQVIEYLGRYTHKIAISNHRIKNIDAGKITFSYKDYTDKGAQKLMVLHAEEFLRRFCMHILPKGFRKIRHYGFLSNRSKQLLQMHQMQMGMVIKPKENKDWKLLTKEKLHFDVEKCPCCKTGKMSTVLSFKAHAPPLWVMKKIDEQQRIPG